MKASYHRHELQFKRPSGTSRGVLKTKETWFIRIENKGNYGIGECGILRGLSIDDRTDYEEKLNWTCQNIQLGKEKLLEELIEFPSIQMGVEMAFISLASKNPHVLFPSDFTTGASGITINGLIWMGEFDFMKQQIEEKLAKGFTCVKLKIGAINFADELTLLKKIRNQFSEKEVELRVDANGAFHPNDALEKLKRLSEFNLHSIEQPIETKQWQDMAELCEKTPFPIALDEELIGVFDVTKRLEMLQTIQPQYIILKPSLVGGFKETKNWIDIAESQDINWWITSALESNVGLNAIAQFTYTLQNKMPQGLGTGSLYTNNISSPLEINGEKLWYNPKKNWDKIE
jgi:o-succinylbenzoate synthase